MPDMEDFDRGGIGHNKPPLREALADATQALRAEYDEIAEAANGLPAEITSDDLDAKASALGYRAAQCWAKLEELRKEEKRPHIVAGKAVDDYFGVFLAKCDAIKKTLAARVGAWKQKKADAERARQAEVAAAQRAEADRLAKEAAEAEASGGIGDAAAAATMAKAAEARAEDAEAAAAAPIAETVRVRDSDSGVVSTGSETYDFTIDDLSKIPLTPLRKHLGKDCIERAVRAFVRAGGRELKGVRIFPKTAVQFRKPG